MSDFVEQSRDPLRPVVETSGHFDECLSALSTATGPVAFDAERAHGHRYWPKAYLFQIRRQGAGTWLIDPIALEQAPARLSDLVSACSAAPWVLHAASQDVPCMTEVGVRPPYLFDTELSARLLGEPSVGLAALLEAKLGIRLRKAHSAANWATRPLPTSWLIYAALDVDYLLELADVLNTELTASGRLSWAREEFAYTLDLFTTPSAPRKEPWRRLSGLQGLRHPVQLAVARALWQEREAIAQQKDRPPSRILPDAAIVGIASKETRRVLYQTHRRWPAFLDSAPGTPEDTGRTGVGPWSQSLGCPRMITRSAARRRLGYRSHVPGNVAIRIAGSSGRRPAPLWTHWLANLASSRAS